MRVLHLSTWQAKCGIATYTDNLVNGLTSLGMANEVYPIHKRVRKYAKPSEVEKDSDNFCQKARDFDVVHIQHEFSFFSDFRMDMPSSIDHFHYLLKSLAAMRKPTAVTFHTEPEPTVPLWPIFLARSGRREMLRAYFEKNRWRNKISSLFRKHFPLLQPIAHSRTSQLALKNSGFSYNRIKYVPHGLVVRNRAALSMPPAVAKERLGYPKECILLSLFGFISAYKGPSLAVKALKNLPRHYHLAIVGGPHPEGIDDLALNKILAMVAARPDLRQRVRITGFAPTETVDLYHAATDICLAPYQKVNISASGALTWALSSGKPVIASKIPSFIELNDKADCLMMFTADAAYELAWQIQRLVADPAYQQVLVANALKYVEANSWPRICTVLAEIYEDMLNSVGATREIMNRTGSPTRTPSTGKAA